MQHARLLGRDSWICCNERSYPPLPPRAFDHRTFGGLALSNNTPTDAPAFIPTLSPRTVAPTFVTTAQLASACLASHSFSLLGFNSVLGNGLPALTAGQYLIDMLSQLFSVEYPLVAFGGQTLPLVRAANSQPCDLPGIAHTPLMRVIIEVFQGDGRDPVPSSILTHVPHVSTVSDSPLSDTAALP